ncbi:hypothetical protein HDU98_010703 [Podochytrium sp. JEL0797]|nr:hypothetical protein HDU98_010703 [Podochytrium sp. JEL0797]
MVSCVVKSLTSFSRAQTRPGETHVVGSYTETSIDSEEVEEEESPIVGSRRGGGGGGVRSFAGAGLKRGASVARREVQGGDVGATGAAVAGVVGEEGRVSEWNPWRGDEIAWSCVLRILYLVQASTRQIRDSSSSSGSSNLEDANARLGVSPSAGATGSQSKRVNEILGVAPVGVKYAELREGLMAVLFAQIRTVGMRDLERLLVIIRGLMLEGVLPEEGDVVGTEKSEGTKDVGQSGVKGIGLEGIPGGDLSKSSLWKALFDVVSGDVYYDQVRQVECVEWYIQLVHDARKAVKEARENTRFGKAKVVDPSVGELRSKL